MMTTQDPTTREIVDLSTALESRARDILTAGRLLNYRLIVQQADLDLTEAQQTAIEVAVTSGELP